jgi:hypothetical protein
VCTYELWGLYEVLSLAWKIGLWKLEVQVDSFVVVDGVQLEKIASAKVWSTVSKIKRLMQHDWEVLIEYIYQEVNGCVNIFANLGCDSNGGFYMFREPPQVVIQCLVDDFRGISLPVGHQRLTIMRIRWILSAWKWFMGKILYNAVTSPRSNWSGPFDLESVIKIVLLYKTVY